MTFLSVLALRNMRARGEVDEVLAFRLHYTMHRVREQHGQSPLPQHMADRLEYLRGRQRLRAAIQENRSGDVVYIGVSQMDCDCSVGTSRHKVEATMEAVNAFLERLYDDAEGPVNWGWLTAAEYAEFRGEHRDLALEAHENGHPHVVFYP